MCSGYSASYVLRQVLWIWCSCPLCKTRMKLSVDFHWLQQALNWTEISQTDLRTPLLPAHRSWCLYVDPSLPLSCLGQLNQLTNPENYVLLLPNISAEIVSWTDFWVGPRESIFWWVNNKGGTTHLFTKQRALWGVVAFTKVFSVFYTSSFSTFSHCFCQTHSSLCSPAVPSHESACWRICNLKPVLEACPVKHQHMEGVKSLSTSR